MKRLKYLFMALVMVICMLGSSIPVSASNYSKGKAIMSEFYTDNITTSYIGLSNITDAPITVTVTLYDNDGSLIKDDNNINTGRVRGFYLINYSDQATDATATFIINPHCTGFVALAPTTDAHYGYGVVQWEQNSNVLQGLVGVGNKVVNSGTNNPSQLYIPINNGLPF